MPIPVAARTEAKALIVCMLRSWVRILNKARMFVFVFPCYSVWAEVFETG
jgi:hypothetical protein